MEENTEKISMECHNQTLQPRGRVAKCIKKLIEKSRVCHNHKPQPILDTKKKRRRTKTYTCKTNKQMYEKHKNQLPFTPSEVIRTLKQTEQRGHRAREDFKTLSAPWRKTTICTWKSNRWPV